MTRPTKLYPRAWIAHHQLQYGRNWRHVAARFGSLYPTLPKGASYSCDIGLSLWGSRGFPRQPA